MQAGRLNEIISVERLVTSDSKYGDQKTEKYVEHLPKIRASVKYENGGRIDDNNELFFANHTIFCVRIYQDIRNLDRIKWRGEDYRILNIERQKEIQQLVIKTELINQ